MITGTLDQLNALDGDPQATFTGTLDQLNALDGGPKATFTGTLDQLNGLWTFIVRDADTSECLYIGCERLKTIPTLRELKRHALNSLPARLTIALFAPVEDDSTLATLRATLEPRYASAPQTPQTPVQCEQTGEVFNNPRQAAVAYGIATGQLYMHLRQRDRYKTCKGLTFKYL